MAELTEGGLVNARIVYWGVEGAGKRTNLQVIRTKLRPDHRGDLRSVPTALDPTVTYTMLPIELGQVGGVRTRIQVVAVPGGEEQAPTRKQLLDEVDGVVFVVDASPDRLESNLQSFEELRSALAAYGRALETVPLVIQYNKRDLGDPYTLEELHRKLSMRGIAAFEAVARDGTAVLQTLTTISKRVIRSLREGKSGAAVGSEPKTAEPASGATTPLSTPPTRQASEPEATRQAETRVLKAPYATETRVLAAPTASAALEVTAPTEIASLEVTAPTGAETLVMPRPDAAESAGAGPTTLASGAVAPEALAIAEPADSEVSSARAILDASFEEAQAAAQASADGVSPSAGSGSFRIVSADPPVVVGERSVRVPMEIEDEAGRRRRLTITVDIDVEATRSD